MILILLGSFIRFIANVFQVNVFLNHLHKYTMKQQFKNFPVALILRFVNEAKCKNDFFFTHQRSPHDFAVPFNMLVYIKECLFFIILFSLKRNLKVNKQKVYKMKRKQMNVILIRQELSMIHSACPQTLSLDFEKLGRTDKRTICVK